MACLLVSYSLEASGLAAAGWDQECCDLHLRMHGSLDRFMPDPLGSTHSEACTGAPAHKAANTSVHRSMDFIVRLADCWTANELKLVYVPDQS